jgi:hypothetical protein
MLVAGESDGSDKGGALMDQSGEKKQMQHSRCRSVLGAATACYDWFADGVDAYFSVVAR